MNNKCKDCGVELTWENRAICTKCKAYICDDCSVKNKYKCENCSNGAKIKLPESIRRSHIEDYKSCPYAFKLNVIDGIEKPQSALAHLGSDLHDLYEHVQLGDITIDELDSQTDWLFENYKEIYDEITLDRMKNRADISNASFKKLYPTLLERKATYEERIYFPIADDLPQVTIAYDRLETDEDGELHLVDWKTGKCMTGKKLTTDLQPALYLKAIEHKYGKMPKTFTLIYLSDVDKKGNFKTRVFERINNNEFKCTVRGKDYIQNIDEQIKVVKKIFSQMKNGHFSIPDKPDFFACKMCYFKEIGKCADAETQRWLNVNFERGL